VIGISNTNYPYKCIRSQFPIIADDINFGTYNKEELYGIIEEYGKFVFNDQLKFVLNLDALRAISNHIATTNGNMRDMASLVTESLRFFCQHGRPRSMVETIRFIKSQQVTAEIISSLGIICSIILFAAWNFSEKYNCKHFERENVILSYH